MSLNSTLIIPNKSEANIKELDRIDQTLHQFLVPPNDAATKYQQTFANLQATSIDQLEASDTSPLRRFIHGLSIGCQCLNTTDQNTVPGWHQYQKEYNGSFTSAESIHTAKCGGCCSSLLKNLVSDKLTACNAGDKVINYFCNIGLSKSTKYITISSDKAVEQKNKGRLESS